MIRRQPGSARDAGNFRYSALNRIGLTLIELLLALALGATVVLLVVQAQRLLNQAGRDRARRAAAGLPAQRLLRQAARELAGAGETERAEAPLRIVRDKDGALLEFVTFATAGETEAPDASVLRRVRYRFVPDPAGAGTLWRLEQALAGVAAAAPEMTNRLLDAVTSWSAEAWDGAQWTSRWPAEGATNRLPAAVRLRLNLGPPAPSTAGVDVWIPAAAVFTSDLQRAAAPGPGAPTPRADRGGR